MQLLPMLYNATIYHIKIRFDLMSLGHQNNHVQGGSDRDADRAVSCAITQAQFCIRMYITHAKVPSSLRFDA